MMLLWMSYSVLATAVLALMAFVFEWSARRLSLPARWLWASAMAAAAGAAVVLFTSPPVAFSTFLATSMRVDRALLAAWLMASASTATVMLLAADNVRLRRKQWSVALADGTEVLVTDGYGPAVVGLFRPKVALPRWVFRAPRDERRMLIAREIEHLHAGDFRLVALSMLLVAVMPWNPVLWLQAQRLRAAIDLDCRSRVINRLLDEESYQIPVIETPVRRRRSYAPAGPMAEASSYLDWRSPSMMPHSIQRAD